MNLFPVPQLQARIEAMPVKKWKSELAKIQDDATRERVRCLYERNRRKQ